VPRIAGHRHFRSRLHRFRPFRKLCVFWAGLLYAITNDVSVGLQVLLSGGCITKKIQAKDCTQGGLFQMEPSRTGFYTHQLAAGFGYFFDARGRLLSTNGTVIERESPETATLQAVFSDGTASRWLVRAGNPTRSVGPDGAVFGEDATE
jgi:hypothetical protein